MAQRSRLPANTAIQGDSVWRYLDQDTFRKHVVDLQRVSNQVPADPIIHSATEWQLKHPDQKKEDYLLPFGVEQRIADDLAFVAAAKEGHREITAVALEEREEPDGLTVRLSANEWISQDVVNTLTIVFDLLVQCASKSNPS